MRRDVIPPADPPAEPPSFDSRRHARRASIPIKRLQEKAMSADEMRRMIHTFVVATEAGERVYTGHVSSRSPSTITLLLTAPYDAAGRIVKISTSDVISEQVAA